MKQYNEKVAIDDLFSKVIVDASTSFFDFSKYYEVRILELGCGRGNRFVEYKGINNFVFYGIEINIDQLHIAKQNDNGRYVCADIEKMPFKEKSFDIIISYSVLQYVNWKNVIDKCSFLLKEEGEILFIETLEGNPLAKAYRFVHKFFNLSYNKYLTPRKHLSVKELDCFKVLFETQYQFYHITTPIVLLNTSVKKAMGKDLYLHPGSIYNSLFIFDRMLIKHFPKLSFLSWYILIYGKKHVKD